MCSRDFPSDALVRMWSFTTEDHKPHTAKKKKKHSICLLGGVGEVVVISLLIVSLFRKLIKTQSPIQQALLGRGGGSK